MAQQGVTLGGAVAGALLGSVIPGVGTVLGAQIGFAIGGVVGGLLFPQKGPKPAKEDLSVQAASYGSPIPLLYGCDRTAGTLIWVDDNKIRRRKVKQGGKGFMGGAAGVTYEYYASWAVLIGEGPIDGIRRIWLDTKLVYDRSGDSLEAFLANGGQSVISSGKHWDIRAYLGTEDQLPDPSIQGDVGAANCSAMRGLVYVVFDDYPLANFANRIPNVSVEYVKSAESAYQNRDLADYVPGGVGSEADPRCDPVGPYLWEMRSGTLIKFDLASSNTAIAVDLEAQFDSNNDPIDILAGVPCADDNGSVYCAPADFTSILVYKFDAETLAYTSHIPAIASHIVTQWSFRSFLFGGQKWLFGLSTNGRLYVIDANTFTLIANPIATGADGTTWNDMVDMTEDLEFWVTKKSTSHLLRYALRPIPDGSYAWTITLVSDINLSGTFSGLDHVHYYVDEGVVLVGEDNHVAKLDPVTETITTSVTGTGHDENAFEWDKGPVNGKLWGKLTGANGAFVELDVPSMTVTRSLSPTLWGAINTVQKVAYDPWTDALIGPSVSGGALYQLFLPRIDPLAIDRADVLSDISDRVGLTASQIDARDFLASRAKARREQLAPTGPIVVISGGQDWDDHQRIWDRLDLLKTRCPSMTLATTAQGKGVDAIAAAWAASREVPLIAFRLNRAHGNAAPFKRNKLLVGLQPIEAIICEGSGVQANLAEAMRAAHIAVTIFRKEQSKSESRRAA